MRLLFYTVLALSAYSTSYAQTLITISGFKPVSPGKVDSCALPTPAGLASLPLFTPATGTSWNLSTVAIAPTPVIYIYKAPTAGFPTGTFVDSNAVAFGTSAANIKYNSWRNVKQSSSATVVLGEEIVKRQAKGLGAITTVAVDSIVFPQQVIAYTRSLPVVKYPATMGSVWVDSAIRAVSFTLSVSSASLTNAPGSHKQVVTSVDSVVGWGRMKVPILGKLASKWINVLQIHHFDVSVDSFFVNGSPASSTILTLLGMTQGQKTTVARTNFLRVDGIRPLLEAVHTTPTHSSTVSLAYINGIDVEEDLSVGSLQAGQFSVFPNPAHGQLNISIPGNLAGVTSYTLVSINGQTISQGSITSGSTAITLPSELTPGIYYLSITDASGAKTTLPVDVQ